MGAGTDVARLIQRGDVRWYRFARPDKQRPVVILTRTAALEFLAEVTVAPVTSTIRDIPTEVVLTRRRHAPDLRRQARPRADRISHQGRCSHRDATCGSHEASRRCAPVRSRRVSRWRDKHLCLFPLHS